MAQIKCYSCVHWNLVYTVHGKEMSSKVTWADECDHPDALTDPYYKHVGVCSTCVGYEQNLKKDKQC